MASSSHTDCKCSSAIQTHHTDLWWCKNIGCSLVHAYPIPYSVRHTHTFSNITHSSSLSPTLPNYHPFSSPFFPTITHSSSLSPTLPNYHPFSSPFFPTITHSSPLSPTLPHYSISSANSRYSYLLLLEYLLSLPHTPSPSFSTLSNHYHTVLTI